MQEFGRKMLADTKLPMPVVDLDMSADVGNSYETDALNVIWFHDGFKFLSRAKASYEQLWGGFCLEPCWNMCSIVTN